MSHRPGNYDLVELKLINFRGDEFDISTLFISFDITEDIYSSSLYGTILMMESIDLAQNFPLIGEEKIKISVKTPDMSSPITMVFNVFEMSNVSEINEKTRQYILNFCSRELLQNRCQRVVRSFKNKKHTDIVESILRQELQSLKPLEVEDCSTVMTYIPPNVFPFEVIASMSTRAKSAKYPNSAGYLFFETMEGFRFVSLDSLIDGDVVHTYRFSKKGTFSEDDEYKYYTVDTSTTDSRFNILEEMMNGALGSTTYSLDLIKRKFETYKVNQFTETKTRTISKFGRHTDEFEFKDGIENSVVKFVPKTNSQQPLKYDSTRDYNVGVRYSQLASLNSGQQSRLNVPGVLSIHAGDIIDLEIPSLTTDETKNMQSDRYQTGKYLVECARFEFIRDGDFTVTMKVNRDSMNDNPADLVDLTLPRIKKS